MGPAIFVWGQIGLSLVLVAREGGRCLAFRCTFLGCTQRNILTRVPRLLRGPPILHHLRNLGRQPFGQESLVLYMWQNRGLVPFLLILWRLFLPLLQFNVCPPRGHRINLSRLRCGSRLHWPRETGLRQRSRRDHAKRLSTLSQLKEKRNPARRSNGRQQI